MKIFILIFVIFVSLNSYAYPDFIGFGYRSCMVCHESGSGGGSLTDYGRGVFASEIAMNSFGNWLPKAESEKVNKWITDEDAINYSNFFGKIELPWWIRIGAKYRALTIEKSPGSQSKIKKHYNMQNEFNLNLFAFEDKSLGLITTLGYIENPRGLAPNKVLKENSYLYMREYFIKYQVFKELWTYLGFIDKTFGIKTANHTAINRSNLQLGQNDQVHSFLAQWARPNEDIFIQYWSGNLHLEKQNQLTGGSFMIDKKWGDSSAYGLSLLSEKKPLFQQSIGAVHAKIGLGHGHSILTELGYKNEKREINLVSAESKNMYLFSQNQLNLARGVFLTSGMEFLKDMSGSSPAVFSKWDLGLLLFPIQRLEFRVSAINQKILNADEASEDQWALQSQIHISL